LVKENSAFFGSFFKLRGKKNPAGSPPSVETEFLFASFFLDPAKKKEPALLSKTLSKAKP